MSEGQEITACRVWATISAEDRQEVFQELNRIFQEVFDANFRFDSAASSNAPRRDLCSTVESASSAHEHGEPTVAVRHEAACL